MCYNLRFLFLSRKRTAFGLSHTEAVCWAAAEHVIFLCIVGINGNPKALFPLAVAFEQLRLETVLSILPTFLSASMSARQGVFSRSRDGALERDELPHYTALTDKPANLEITLLSITTYGTSAVLLLNCTSKMTFCKEPVALSFN